MKEPIVILHLEDNLSDCELLAAALKELKVEVRLIRVETEAAFQEQLERPEISLVISDFTLPSYSGLLALRIAREKRPDVPFIFFSGTIGEESAVETLRNGATDYVLKHRPRKMLAAVERALRERKERLARIRAESALKRKEEWFRTLIENALDVISIIDRDGNFVYNSPSIERVLGYGGDELAAVNAFSLIHPDDRAKARAELAETLDPASTSLASEFRLRHKNGSWRHLELKAQRLPVGHEVDGIVINARDITEKKQTEEQFLRAQRMECLGVLAGGIAHDINNILAPVMMGADLLKDFVSAPDGLAMIDLIQTSARRGSDIVKQVLSFARGVRGENSTMDVRRVVSEMTNLLRETLPRTIQVQVDFAPETDPVVCNPTEIYQVLMNLCVNARDAMPEGGLLRIEVRNHREDPAAALHPAGRFVRIAVSDTGTGIPPDDLERVFEPFYTTKEEGKGTGLGLPTVRAIVRRHSGRIEVASTLGQGTRFAIYLPAAQPAAQPAQPAAILPAGRGQTVMLVEDEEAILELAKAVLENANYQVAVALNGLEALAQLRAKPASLIIADWSMPILHGSALIRELRQLLPAAKIICTTGESEPAEMSALPGVIRVLHKPYSCEELLGAVAAAFHPPEPEPIGT